MDHLSSRAPRRIAKCLNRSLKETYFRWKVRHYSEHPHLTSYCHQIIGNQFAEKLVELPLERFGPELGRKFPLQGGIGTFNVAAAVVLIIELIKLIVEHLPSV